MSQGEHSSGERSERRAMVYFILFYRTEAFAEGSQKT